VIYYKNTPVQRVAGRFSASEVRVLTPDEVNLLVIERKVTPIAEIKYDKRGGRISRPRNWVNYER
jgi:hypothetical protein